MGRDLGEKLEVFELLPAAAIIIDEDEEKLIRHLKEKGVFQEIAVITSEADYALAKSRGATKLAVRDEIYRKIKNDLVHHYYVVVGGGAR